MSNNRNKPCECGSGKKYKKCCMIKEDMPVEMVEEKGENIINRKRMHFSAILGLAMNLEADRRNRMFR